MEQTEQAHTPQPKKSRKGLIIGGIVAFIAITGIVGANNPKTDTNNSSQPTTTTQNIPAASSSDAPAATAQTTPTETQKAPVSAPAPAPVTTPTPKSCPPGYYVNADNNCIQSPTAAPSAPAGATAKCGDGTYSFSAHRSGTCSHHGGVAIWL